MLEVAVIGAGIIGLSCAVRMQENFPDIKVVVISKEFTPHTTGDGSGGLWYPYLCGNTPSHLLKKWGIETYRFLHQLWLEGGHHICAMPIYNLHTRDQKIPDWSEQVFGFRTLDNKNLDYVNRLYSTKFSSGHCLTTFVVPPTPFLEYLQQRFESAGGILIKNEVKSLGDKILEKYTVILNCTGIGARELVKDNVFPIRGQITKVKSSWINETIVDYDGGNYIIPNANHCVLGGTHQENDYTNQVNEDDKHFIMKGCFRMIPGLQHASIISDWVGLRPGRQEVRLEAENIREKLVVHNYGHGGSGFTLFWGCAGHVLEIVEEHLKVENSQSNKCKL